MKVQLSDKAKDEFVDGEGGNGGRGGNGGSGTRTRVIGEVVNNINIDPSDQVVRTVQKKLLQFSDALAWVSEWMR